MLTVLFVIGITAEAMTAALAAGRQRMDLFGVCMIACVTALGGGTMRDLLLAHYPLRWVNEPVFLLIVVVAALVTVLTSVLMSYFRTIFLLLDSLGLAAFSVLGTQVALGEGHGLIIACMAAVVTGVFGGVARDILCDRVPLVFSDELYASVAFVAAVLYYVMHTNGVPEQVTVIVTLVVAFTLRVLSIYFKISLPVFEYQERHYARDPAGRLTMWILNRAGVRRRTLKKKRVGNVRRQEEEKEEEGPEGR